MFAWGNRSKTCLQHIALISNETKSHIDWLVCEWRSDTLGEAQQVGVRARGNQQQLGPRLYGQVLFATYAAWSTGTSRQRGYYYLSWKSFSAAMDRVERPRRQASVNWLLFYATVTCFYSTGRLSMCSPSNMISRLVVSWLSVAQLHLRIASKLRRRHRLYTSSVARHSTNWCMHSLLDC